MVSHSPILPFHLVTEESNPNVILKKMHIMSIIPLDKDVGVFWGANTT